MFFLTIGAFASLYSLSATSAKFVVPTTTFSCCWAASILKEVLDFRVDCLMKLDLHSLQLQSFTYFCFSFWSFSLWITSFSDYTGLISRLSLSVFDLLSELSPEAIFSFFNSSIFLSIDISFLPDLSGPPSLQDHLL